MRQRGQYRGKWENTPEGPAAWRRGVYVYRRRSLPYPMFDTQDQPISYHDLHATMLHLLGLDHTKLTYRFNGRDMRLTDVYGTLIPQITNT